MDFCGSIDLIHVKYFAEIKPFDVSWETLLGALLLTIGTRSYEFKCFVIRGKEQSHAVEAVALGGFAILKAFLPLQLNPLARVKEA